MTFADKLRSLREEKGIDRQAFADQLGVSLPTIISWERGDRTPPFQVIQVICKNLSVNCTVFDGCQFADARDKPGRGRPKKIELNEKPAAKRKRKKEGA